MILGKKKPNWFREAVGALSVGGIPALVLLVVYLAASQEPKAGAGPPEKAAARPERAVADPPRRQPPTVDIAPVRQTTEPSRKPVALEPTPTAPQKTRRVNPVQKRSASATRIPPENPPLSKVDKPPRAVVPSVQSAPQPAPEQAQVQESATATAAPETKPGDAPYIDKLIDPTVTDEAPTTEAREEKGLSRYGPGLLGIEYRFFDSKTSGDVDASITEHGLGVVLRQETVAFGRFDLQAAVTDQEQDPGPDLGDGTAIRLIQTDLPLSATWAMDNLLGNVLATTPPLISSSYRLRLPAPYIEGLSSRLRRGDTTVAVTAGDLGIERGRTFLVFDDTTRSGSIAGVAATHQLDPLWSVGLQWWDVDDASVDGGTSSHTSVAGVAQYRDFVTRQKGLLHFLRNDDGALGVWLDGELSPDLWQHNFGVFRLDPDLLWIDRISNVNNDRQGGYWTGTYRKFRTRIGFGVDAYETNLDDNPTLVGRKVVNSFVNGSYQIDRRSNISASVGLVSQRPGSGLPSPDEDTQNVRATVSHRFDNGTSFWTVGVSDTDGGPIPTTRSEFLWDHEWKVRATDRLRTGVEYQREERPNDTLTQTSFRVSAHRNFDNGRFGLNGSASIGVGGDGITDDGRVTSVNLSFDWRLMRTLKMSLELNWNKNVAELVNGQEIRVTERSTFLALRYDMGWGRRRFSVGQQSGKRGHGRIAGTVFLDANRNGVQEPDEAGVPNVTVYLDRGFSVETDSKGRFELWPVPTGEHVLAVSLDNVPLPWGLDDESPRRVDVSPRSESQLNYALTRLNQ